MQESFLRVRMSSIFQRPSGKKNGTEKSEGGKAEAEEKKSEAVANGALASEEAAEAAPVEPVKEPELDEEEKERRRLQEEEQRRQEEIVSTSLHLWGYFSPTRMHCRLPSKNSLTK